jgi:O-succinylbenzoic acid--CoA ligase
VTAPIPNPLAQAARAAPSRLALRVDTPGAASDGLTYDALAEAAARLAGALAQAGVRAGDVVAIDEPLSRDGVVALHAAGWLGAVMAPLAPSEPGGPLAADDLARLAPACVITPRTDAPWPCRAVAPTARAEARLAPAPWPLDAPRVALTTSGSSGVPKRLVLDGAQLCFAAMGSALRLGHLPSDVWLLTLPLHHVGGLSIVLRAAWGAVSVELHPRFDAERVADALARVTLGSLVPTQLTRVLDVLEARATHGARAPFALRALLVGGDRTPPALRARAAAMGLPIALTWGMTESAAQLATSAPGEAALADDGVVGPPLAFVDVEADAEGRLVARGPQLPGGVLVTADRGALLEDGRIRVDGRADLVFISGGENVDPLHVERVLSADPDVAAARVLGQPDPTWGHCTVALLVARGEARPDAEALAARLADRLRPAERPRRVWWVDTLPTTALGKPSRALPPDLEDSP